MVRHGENKTTLAINIRHSAFEAGKDKFIDKWGFNPVGMTFEQIVKIYGSNHKKQEA